VQANYEPFLARGVYYPVHGPRWDYMNGTEPGPVSYSRLLDSKSLDTFEDFVELATKYKNDRPRWQDAKTEEDWAEYRRRYEEFKKLAPIWVELGVLRHRSPRRKLYRHGRPLFTHAL